MQAALGVSQLAKLDEFIKIRKENFSTFMKTLNLSMILFFQNGKKKQIQVGLDFLYLLKRGLLSTEQAF